MVRSHVIHEQYTSRKGDVGSLTERTEFLTRYRGHIVFERAACCPPLALPRRVSTTRVSVTGGGMGSSPKNHRWVPMLVGGL